MATISLISLKISGFDDGLLVEQKIGEGEWQKTIFTDGEKFSGYYSAIFCELAKTLTNLNKDKKWN